ncbi:hypothetical protein QUF99_25545 [Bacillus sp. DX4.1]|uniref:hypothetical protein n=1 Tax=Bacillus sp. DX4.1 TaxID=3055867 RepID=UPI0025A2C4DF|nr:hypothetical protein [Bacillus sp. DX4.1]MDM5190566.1 hypothetical protein [Bacillus sp. DX4.1]
MKHIFYLFITMLFTFFIFTGCIDPSLSENSSPQTHEAEKSVKKEVWNQLSNQEKQNIIGDWENATMTKTVLHKYNSHQTNEAYEGKAVYLIHFPSDASAPKNIEVYVDIDTNEIVGYNK